MARRCEITGRGTQSGNNVSHSHKKTKRKFKINIHKKRIWSEEEKKFITLRISTRALRTIQKKGLKAVLKSSK